MILYNKLARSESSIDVPSAVEFRQVSIHRGNIKITGTMSMKFSAGSISGFFGDNGTGKSSLLKAAAGILTEGVHGQVIWFERHDRLTDSLRRKVGIQLQSTPVFANLTVIEQLRLVAANRLAKSKQIQNSVATVFDDFPVLAERQNIRASTLNGGTRRLLSIGLACCGLTRGLLILDEPTNDLGRELAVDVGLAIRRLAERDQNAVIMVSHDFQWLKTIVDSKRLFTLRNKPKEDQTNPANLDNSTKPIRRLTRVVKASYSSTLTTKPSREMQSTGLISSDQVPVLQSHSSPAQVAACERMPETARTEHAFYATDSALTKLDSPSSVDCLTLIDMECFPLLSTSSDDIPEYVGEMI